MLESGWYNPRYGTKNMKYDDHFGNTTKPPYWIQAQQSEFSNPLNFNYNFIEIYRIFLAYLNVISPQLYI